MARFDEQKLYIGGRYVDSTSGVTFESIPIDWESLSCPAHFKSDT